MIALKAIKSERLLSTPAVLNLFLSSLGLFRSYYLLENCSQVAFSHIVTMKTLVVFQI